MTAVTSLAKSLTGLVIGVCVALTLLFGLLFGSFRIGLVTGIAAGAIIAMSLMLLDVTREEVDNSKR